jgi:deoxyribose-phosphate aldolase
VQEALIALNEGADELDVVINVGAALDGDWAVVERDLSAIATATAITLADGAHAVRKAILECCYLTDEDKARAGRLALDAGFEYLKTSTGFGPSGATVEDVRLLKGLTGAHSSGGRVKAAGGIRTLGHLTSMIRAGATLIGTSNGPAIMHEALGAGS